MITKHVYYTSTEFSDFFSVHRTSTTPFEKNINFVSFNFSHWGKNYDAPLKLHFLQILDHCVSWQGNHIEANQLVNLNNHFIIHAKNNSLDIIFMKLTTI